MDIQNRLRDELKQAIDDNNGFLTYEMISSLEYLDMVINESLRMFPPAYNLLRLCDQDFKIPDTDLVIPKGTDVWINIYSHHRDPEYFPQPEKFDPERFSAEMNKFLPSVAFIPFGAGPRKCIGGED